MSEKISEFINDSNVTDSSLITYVKDNQNYTVTQEEYVKLFGVTGSLVQEGSVTGTPVLDTQGSVNNIRNLENGSGVKASVSAENGITLAHNFTVNGVGTPIIENPLLTSPVIRSLVGTGGVGIAAVGDTIVIDADAGGLVNRVIVTQASDLTGALDSTKEYFIDGIIDMGSNSIEVPTGGLNLSGYNFDVSKLISSASAYTMFTSPGGGSGNLLGKDFGIEVTGTGSQVYNLVSATGFDAFEFARLNYNDCTSLGTIDSYRQGLESGTGRFGGTPTLTLKGAWAGGFFIDTSIVRNLDAAMNAPLFKAGAGFTMASRFRSNQNIDLGATASFFDFASSNFTNPSTLQLDGCIITRNGVSNADDATITPNITSSDLASEWKGNQGLTNTFEGGTQNVTVETATVISATSTYYDLNGTWTATDLQHFDAPSNGQLRHLGTSPREYRIVGDLVISGTSNNEVSIKIVKWDDSASGFVDVGSQVRQINALVGGRDVAFFNATIGFTLDQNDYIKIQVANNTSTGNVTAELDSFFTILER